MSVRGRLVVVALALVWSVVALRVATEVRRADDRFRHHDFRTLAQHQELFYRGVYPNRGVEAAPAGEHYHDSVYPPYSFVLAIPWLPPGVGRMGREVWFTFCQAAACIMLLGFAWRMGRELDRGLGWLLLGAAAAATGLWADFLFGNFSAITAAALVGLYHALRGGAAKVAGIAWVAAMLKPQVGAMFVALLWEKRHRPALWLGAGLLGIAMASACAWAGVSPWRAVSGVYFHGLFQMAGDGHSLVSLVRMAGVPASLAQPITAAAGMTVLAWTLRPAAARWDMLGRMAWVALVARLCLYHRPCDDVLLVFPLIFLGREAWRGDRRAWTAVVLLCVTLWLPTRLVEITAIKVGVVGAWLGLGVMMPSICRASGRIEQGDGASGAPRRFSV